jgi:hypothetical protein
MYTLSIAIVNFTVSLSTSSYQLFSFHYRFYFFSSFNFPSSSVPSFYLDSTQFSTSSDSISNISRPQGLPQDLFQDFLQEIVYDSTSDYSNASFISQNLIHSSDKFLLPICITNTPNHILSEPVTTYIAAKKKYKPVHLKVKPVIGELPRIIRNIIGDLLKDLPTLPMDPPGFKPSLTNRSLYKRAQRQI